MSVGLFVSVCLSLYLSLYLSVSLCLSLSVSICLFVSVLFLQSMGIVQISSKILGHGVTKHTSTLWTLTESLAMALSLAGKDYFLTYLHTLKRPFAYII